MKYCYLDSPMGLLLIAGDGQGLKRIGFPSGKGRLQPEPDWMEDAAAFRQVSIQFDQYWIGERKTFDLPVVPDGTPFQIDVLNALRQIPYGETRSYADIARKLGRPKAVRAVGAANGRNPLPIIIPCHRVIGANGSLTGFGGGLAAKQYLLDLEQGLQDQFALIH